MSRIATRTSHAASRAGSTAKRVLGRLAYKNYYVARAYHNLLLRRSFARENVPLLVYQMGKVGSTSLCASLRAANFATPIWHVHFLSDEILGRLDRIYRRSWPEGNARHLWKCHFLRKQIDRGLRGLKVVTLTRDPIARNVSAFFESLTIAPLDAGSAYRVKSVDYDFEITLHVERLETLVSLFLEKFDHETPSVFFDREIEGVLGIDALSTTFPASKGYHVYRGERADLLVLRLEDLEERAAEAMKAFLGVNNIQLIRSNIGSQKEHGFIYESFIHFLRLPEAYIDEMYMSKYARHFYTDEEIEGFKRKWSGGSFEPLYARHGS